MPTYDYKCSTCGRTFEYQQKMSEDALTTCPPEVCENPIKGKGEVHRVLSKNIGLVFKGSGFYLTDYVHKSSSSASQPNNDSGKSESAKPETSSSSSAATGSTGNNSDAA